MPDTKCALPPWMLPLCLFPFGYPVPSAESCSSAPAALSCSVEGQELCDQGGLCSGHSSDQWERASCSDCEDTRAGVMSSSLASHLCDIFLFVASIRGSRYHYMKVMNLPVLVPLGCHNRAPWPTGFLGKAFFFFDFSRCPHKVEGLTDLGVFL